MMLTTKARYAIMALADMLINYDNQQKPISLHQISANQFIALNYLEQIFAKLKRHDIVSSFKGPGGGYVITRKLSDISILMVMDAVEEKVKITRCGKDNTQKCMSNGSKCLTHNLWNSLNNKINDYLSSVTLEDLKNGNFDVAK